MDILHITVLAVVQGITEFLPVSSSAHLVLVPALTSWPDQGIVFDIALHLGTLLAVLLYFWRDVGHVARGKWDILHGRLHTPQARLVSGLAVATLPILVFGMLLMGWVAESARFVPLLAATSIGFGLLLWYADQKPVTKPQNTDVHLQDALIFGLFQALAIIPGTSRSGACVTAGRLLGYNRQQAGRFGTLMAVPTIALSGVASVWDANLAALNWQTQAPALLSGMLIAFLCGLAGIHLLMSLLARSGYWPFVLYRIALGTALLVWYYCM